MLWGGRLISSGGKVLSSPYMLLFDDPMPRVGAVDPHLVYPNCLSLSQKARIEKEMRGENRGSQ